MSTTPVLGKVDPLHCEPCNAYVRYSQNHTDTLILTCNQSIYWLCRQMILLCVSALTPHDLVVMIPWSNHLWDHVIMLSACTNHHSTITTTTTITVATHSLGPAYRENITVRSIQAFTHYCTEEQIPTDEKWIQQLLKPPHQAFPTFGISDKRRYFL